MRSIGLPELLLAPIFLLVPLASLAITIFLLVKFVGLCNDVKEMKNALWEIARRPRTPG
jgi:hypothetical protein